MKTIKKAIALTSFLIMITQTMVASGFEPLKIVVGFAFLSSCVIGSLVIVSFMSGE